jgi:hypothetical protein
MVSNIIATGDFVILLVTATSSIFYGLSGTVQAVYTKGILFLN